MTSTKSSLSVKLFILASISLGMASQCTAANDDEAFHSAWPTSIQRTWAGPQYWSNRLQDWQTVDGRLECLSGGANRNVHVLTRRLGEKKGDLRMSVRLGRLDQESQATGGWMGFRLGARARIGDYRNDAVRGKGINAGVNGSGELFIGGDVSPDRRVEHRGIPRKKWKVIYVDTEETAVQNARGQRAIDGKAKTIWHTRYSKNTVGYPHEIRIDMGAAHTVAGFCYLPRQDKQIGRIKEYEFYVSADGKDWGEPIKKGTFKDNAKLQEVSTEQKQGRYIRLVAKSGVINRPAAVIAELFVLDPASAAGKKARRLKPARVDTADVELRLTADPDGNTYSITLAAHHPETGKKLAETTTPGIAANDMLGSMALVCHSIKGGATFSDWQIAGSKVDVHEDRTFGPILFTQYTLSRGLLTMTAQMAPIGKEDAQVARLQVHETDTNEWQTVREANIDKLARTATFRVEDWDATHDTRYRVAYSLIGPDDKPHDHYWAGTIRHDPVEKEAIVIAAFTGNVDYGFPNEEVVKHVKIHNPDFLFFSGDQIYESVAGYGVQRSPLDKACLDYLRKWYLYGWAYADILRDRPCVSIPDDHDVYQGNVWGQGGRPARRGDDGGYTMDPRWVNMIQKTQTSNLPPPYDPTPVKQGITVYYSPITYGRISFAVIEDRKFKTGPRGVVPKTKGRPDHVTDPNFDPKTADVPGAKLLGDRQLEFLDDWAADWRGADMKVALSQTVLAGVATHHGGGRMRLVADYDSNGWPQTGRNKALDRIRRGFGFMICGDQHLATIVHHGIDDWNDAGWSFTVPCIANLYPRAWMPSDPPKNHQPGMPDYTGEFLDGLGNHVTVWAATNMGKSPGVEPTWLHDKMPGYGIIRLNKKTRKITMECWPRYVNPQDPKTGDQYLGWPKTIDQLDNYGREAVAWLPTITVDGMTDPVVQVIDQANGEIVYTLRIKGTTFRPKVFKDGSYTVKVGEPGTDKLKTVENIRSERKPDSKLNIEL